MVPGILEASFLETSFAAKVAMVESVIQIVISFSTNQNSTFLNQHQGSLQHVPTIMAARCEKA